jgi:hypothetical protein
MTHEDTYITLDEVIRLTLAKNHLPTHYYMPYLIHGKEALRFINYVSWPVLKTAVMTPVSGVYTLPTDCVKANEIYRLVGDRKRPLVEDRRLVKSNGPFSDYSSSLEAQELWGDSTSRGISVFQGREFDRGRDFPLSYAKITGDTFRVTTNNETNQDLYVEYTTIPKRTGTSSLIHPLAQDMVSAFIKYQWVMNGKMKRLDVALFKSEFDNALRIFRANVHHVVDDIVSRSQRKGAN